MIHRRSLGLLVSAAAIPLIAATTAACGSGGGGASAASGTSTTHAGSAPPPGSGQPPTVGVADNGKLGQILVDANGRTLYLFKKDTGATSTCTGGCAAAWPPLLATSAPTAGAGASASLVGTSPRPDGGGSQVTYNGHPLYLFVKDQKPGDTVGEKVTAFGGEWDAVSPAGTSANPPESSGSGNGY